MVCRYLIYGQDFLFSTSRQSNCNFSSVAMMLIIYIETHCYLHLILKTCCGEMTSVMEYVISTSLEIG